ncbi:LysM peptidoglycan-binding domain-containing protein [Salinibius halmophilus]|uniref:LysM peptidoglycan-binding domain-containing protein n=1 Tax=Salinibius halmophilus TaxID=1853216 RepID=UPI000E66A8B7|nr:LysM peptidoglycan-binding domain-containing protein [Salinibius halmophilus]
MRIIKATIVLSGIFLAACQTLPTATSETSSNNIPTREPTIAASPEPVEAEAIVENQQPLADYQAPNTLGAQALEQEIIRLKYPDDLWARLRSQMQLDHDVHSRMEPHIAYYARHQGYIDRVSERSSRYIYHIMNEIEARGLPAELALLPIVESAYDAFAYSHGRASGLWQFIPSTGRAYGLEQDWWYDGRRDVIAATDAALTYLAKLNDQFDGDWMLALAAYNSGAGTVRRAQEAARSAGKSTDYWSLSLPRETRQYVPKLLALSAIIEDPESYGIELPSITDEPYFEVVDIAGQIDLAQVAQLSGVSTDEIYMLNPAFNRWATRPEGPHRILVPINHANQLREGLAQLPDNERLNWNRHVVKSGESLIVLAKKYNTTVDVIRDVNGITGNLIRVGEALMIPTASASEYRLSSESRLSANQEREREGNRVEYEVQAGDSFWLISQKYGVSSRSLAAWNNMAPGDTLRIGQKLVIWTTQQVAATTSDRTVTRRVSYTVRNGDSLSSIGQRFRVSVNQLREWNDDLGRYLQPGDRLTIHVNVTQ